MSKSKKNVKSAFDMFEKEDFISAKEIISDQIRKARDAYLKEKLGLKNDIKNK